MVRSMPSGAWGVEQGRVMDPDMNKYDTQHAATGHSKMSPDELQNAYRSACWDEGYG